jgi:hypothetical protein
MGSTRKRRVCSLLEARIYPDGLLYDVRLLEVGLVTDDHRFGWAGGSPPASGELGKLHYEGYMVDVGTAEGSPAGLYHHVPQPPTEPGGTLWYMGKRSSVYLTNDDLARIKACDLTPIVLIRMGLDAFEAIAGYREIIAPGAFDAVLPAEVPVTDRRGGRRIGTAKVTRDTRGLVVSGTIGQAVADAELDAAEKREGAHTSAPKFYCPHPKARRSKGGLCMACGENVG